MRAGPRLRWHYARPAWSVSHHLIKFHFKDEPKITQAFRTDEGVGWLHFVGFQSGRPAIGVLALSETSALTKNGRSCCAGPSGLRAILWHGVFARRQARLPIPGPD